jgi:hypothetical protein
MYKPLKIAGLSLLASTLLFAIPTVSLAQNTNANSNATDKSNNGKKSAPEINPVAAGAVGMLVVGGLALLTTRRRSEAR